MSRPTYNDLCEQMHGEDGEGAGEVLASRELRIKEAIACHVMASDESHDESIETLREMAALGHVEAQNYLDTLVDR